MLSQCYSSTSCLDLVSYPVAIPVTPYKDKESEDYGAAKWMRLHRSQFYIYSTLVQHHFIEMTWKQLGFNQCVPSRFVFSIVLLFYSHVETCTESKVLAVYCITIQLCINSSFFNCLAETVVNSLFKQVSPDLSIHST